MFKENNKMIQNKFKAFGQAKTQLITYMHIYLLKIEMLKSNNICNSRKAKSKVIIIPDEKT